MIMALLRAKLEVAKVKGSGLAKTESELDTAERVVRTEKWLEISNTLRRTMAKWDREV